MADSIPQSAPIIIYSFDRPKYLDRFCRSLINQKLVVLNQENIHICQDGGYSSRTGIQYAAPENLAECQNVFLSHFPRGIIHASKENLGIALNILKGERIAFETMNAEYAFFFEDDLELGPYYLYMIESIAQQTISIPNVAYFAAYGDHRNDNDPQNPKIIELEHNWGFGLKRDHWRRIQDWMRPFYDVYNVCDYKWRPHLAISELFMDKDVAHMQTSQDIVKTMACASLGFARINTDVCYASYIGEVGQSFNKQTFEAMGFGRMQTVDQLPSTQPTVNQAAIDALVQAAHERHSIFRRERYLEELKLLKSKMTNPLQEITREQAEWLWALIMDRQPNEDFFEKHVGRTKLRAVRDELVSSLEARGKSSYGTRFK